MNNPVADGNALVPYEPPTHIQPAMIRPLATAETAKQAIAAYEDLKRAIVRPDDQHRDKQGRTYLKKSFWRRIASCFGVSLELAREDYIIEGDSPIYGYSVVYRAIAPNGQSVEGDGLCMSNERPGMRRHDVRATAHTRAKNRAISDLVGGGEVSAEEVSDDRDTQDFTWQDVVIRAAALGANKAQQLAMKGRYKTPQLAMKALDNKERELAQVAAGTNTQSPDDDIEPDVTFTVESDPAATSDAGDAPIPHDLRNLHVPGARH